MKLFNDAIFRSPPGPVQKSASMDFQFHADYSRSASNSPTATKRFGFYLSSSDFQVWTSQEELTCHSKYKTLPSPGKYRSASVADVLNEDSLTVN